MMNQPNSSDNRPPGCEKCKKDCTIHVTQIVNGKVKKVDMCESCPKAKQMQDPTQFGLMEQLLGLALGQQGGIGDLSLLKCENCGYTEGQFKKTGRLGCSECYNVFVAPRIEILRNIQESTVHKGKVPKGGNRSGALRQRIVELEQDLQQHIRTENYEMAASVRDEIKALREELENGGKVVKAVRRGKKAVEVKKEVGEKEAKSKVKEKKVKKVEEKEVEGKAEEGKKEKKPATKRKKKDGDGGQK